MKSFKEYLTESKKTYDFKIKIAKEMTTDEESNMKRLLGRFTNENELKSFKKSKTPIQALPLDFPQVKNCEVNIYEISLDFPTTQFELTEYLSSELGVGKQRIVVRRPGEPSEEYQREEPQREGALLYDPNYKESANAKFEDFYGDKYNTGFVKELNDILKLQRKERGEQIPTEGAAKYNTDNPAHSAGVLKQAPDPRK
ncbi:MAG: hypothetical protein EBU90_12000 [Proteobacteria bacterium]|nr:hypothetical protein [Pseudomonadota bacterium]NBP14830.1 hypothetical protein [bacterium]